MVSRTHQALINKLFPGDPISQRMAANFVEAYASNPQIGEARVEALLQEAARANAAIADGSLTRDAAFKQLAGFAEVSGLQEHLINDGMAFLESGAGLTRDELAALEAPAAEPTEAPPAPQLPQASAQPVPAPETPLVDRNALRQQIAKHEANMKAPQGSEQWLDYWKRGGDAEYREALEGLERSTDALAGIAAASTPAASPSPQSAPAAAAAPSGS
jgi:hypothetical protein